MRSKELSTSDKIQLIESVAERYRREHPYGYQEMLTYARFMKEVLTNERGISREGTMRFDGSAPIEIWIWLRQVVMDFGRSREDCALLWRVLSGLKIGKDQPRCMTRRIRKLEVS